MGLLVFRGFSLAVYGRLLKLRCLSFAVDGLLLLKGPCSDISEIWVVGEKYYFLVVTIYSGKLDRFIIKMSLGLVLKPLESEGECCKRVCPYPSANGILQVRTILRFALFKLFSLNDPPYNGFVISLT